MQRQQRSSLRHLKSQNGFCWRGREDVKNILWKTPPASKPQRQPFSTIYQDPTSMQPGQGRALKGRQGDKRDHYAADCPWVWLTGVISWLICINHSEALLGIPCIRSKLSSALLTHPGPPGTLVQAEGGREQQGWHSTKSWEVSKESNCRWKTKQSKTWIGYQGEFPHGKGGQALEQAVVQSRSLEVFQSHAGVAPGATGSRWAWQCWGNGELHDLRGLFPPKRSWRAAGACQNTRERAACASTPAGTCGKNAFQRTNSKLIQAQDTCTPVGTTGSLLLRCWKKWEKHQLKVHWLTPGLTESSMQFQHGQPAAGSLHFWSYHGERPCSNTHNFSKRLFPGCPRVPSLSWTRHELKMGTGCDVTPLSMPWQPSTKKDSKANSRINVHCGSLTCRIFHDSVV